MKKLLLIMVIAVMTASAYGQGGSWYVGGVASYNSSKTDTDLNPTTNSWSFGPEVGTFFNADWSAGIALGLSGSSSKDDDEDIQESSQFAPTLYGRRWWKAGDKLGIFAGLDLSFGSGKTTYHIPEDEEFETSSFGVNVNAGVAYALADRWTLLFKFAGLGYRSEKEGDVTTNSFGLLADGNITANQFIFVGLYYTFIPAPPPAPAP